MDVRTVRADNKVEADRGMVSVERGPLVYCAEWRDNAFDIMSVLLNREPKFSEGKLSYSSFIADSLKTKLQHIATRISLLLLLMHRLWHTTTAVKLTKNNVKLELIPYFAWCHRGSGNMKVWFHRM